MNQIRNYYVKLPLACDVDEELAAEFERHLGELYDIDGRRLVGPLARKFGELVTERMHLAFAGWPKYAEWKSYEYGKRLGNYIAAMYGLNAKGEGDAQELAIEKAELQGFELAFPRIKALMTVADASTVGLLVNGVAGPLSSWN